MTDDRNEVWIAFLLARDSETGERVRREVEEQLYGRAGLQPHLHFSHDARKQAEDAAKMMLKTMAERCPEVEWHGYIANPYINPRAGHPGTGNVYPIARD